jgi:fatty acid desaturase
MEKVNTMKIPAELKSVSNISFGWRALVWVAILSGGAYLASSQNAITISLGIVILGLGIAHGVELCHQALHNTAFTNGKANEILGLAMGLPLLVSFYEYRISHLAHHKYVGTPEDTEYFDYGDGPLSIWSFLGILSMWRHYARFIGNLGRFAAGKPIPGFREKHQSILRIYYMAVIAFVAALVAFGLLSGNGLRPLLTWVAAMVLVAGPVHALIEFPEHYKCDSDTKNILLNTRSIQTNWFMSWFTNGNNFHVEHHMHPTVPLQNARQVHSILHPEHGHYNNGYRTFYRSVFGRKYKQATS